MINTHPHYLYSDIVNSIKADKASIEAMTGLLDGTIAYATDTNEFGTYSLNTNTWTWVGASALLYVQDEGVPVGTPSTLNFVGNNVSVSISGTVARVFVTGSSDSVVGNSFDNFWNSGTRGNYAIRAKNDSTVNALGNYAFAIGQNSIASGAYSYAQGFQTRAINDGASAEGNLTVASGVNAHAEGNGSIASGNDSHAEGSGIASGDTSHAEGLGSKAYGAGSHAEGIVTVASGTYSFAGGNANHAIGIASAALGGRNNRVLGNNSVVLGGSGTVGVADDTVFVPKLNIRNIQTGTPLLNLGADIDGNIVIGTTGSSTAAASSDGWNASNNTWTFLLSDSPSYVIYTSANVTGTIGTGMKFQLTHQSQTKNFFITNTSITGSTTYLNLYGGTDYTLNITGTITNPKYSQAKSPFGFPVNPNKWRVTFTNTTQCTQANPVQNTWYNAGSLSVNIPVGLWEVSLKVAISVIENSSSGNCLVTLSTTNNSESNPNMTGFMALAATGATAISNTLTVFVSDVYDLSAKQTNYFNISTTLSGISNIYMRNELSALLFVAQCAYL